MNAEYAGHVVDEGCDTTFCEEIFHCKVETDTKLDGFKRPDSHRAVWFEEELKDIDDTQVPVGTAWTLRCQLFVVIQGIVPVVLWNSVTIYYNFVAIGVRVDDPDDETCAVSEKSEHLILRWCASVRDFIVVSIFEDY